MDRLTNLVVTLIYCTRAACIYSFQFSQTSTVTPCTDEYGYSQRRVRLPRRVRLLTQTSTANHTDECGFSYGREPLPTRTSMGSPTDECGYHHGQIRLPSRASTVIHTREYTVPNE